MGSPRRVKDRRDKVMLGVWVRGVLRPIELTDDGHGRDRGLLGVWVRGVLRPLGLLTMGALISELQSRLCT